MDHLVIALLNTAAEAEDPLETPLGTARWWAQARREAAPLPLAGGKPRFDAGLCERLRTLRASLARRAAGADDPLPVPFSGDPSDALLFELLHTACSAVRLRRFERIRRCARQACGRYFADETKNGSRRWCSLRCMERARAPRRRRIAM